MDRPHYGGGMGPLIPGRIPWRDVANWAKYHDQDAGLLDYFVRELDTIYIEWHAAEVSKK